MPPAKRAKTEEPSSTVAEETESTVVEDADETSTAAEGRSRAIMVMYVDTEGYTGTADVYGSVKGHEAEVLKRISISKDHEGEWFGNFPETDK